MIENAPDLLDEALAHQIVTCERDEDGEPYEGRLNPAVEYSLFLMRDPLGYEPADGQAQGREDRDAPTEERCRHR